jgi:orotidine-5'-phosphate decarboxylase
MKSTGERIIVALDVDTEAEAKEIVLELGRDVGGFKVGLELLNSAGIEIVRKISALGAEVMFDAKFNDIPSVVAGAARAVTRLAVKMFTIHTMGGLDMMKAAVDASKSEAERLGIESPLVLGVTVLTSIDERILNEEIKIPGSVDAEVVHLAAVAKRAGVQGIVASPLELDQVRKTLPPELIIVTPGIRPAWAGGHDQKRTATPTAAIQRGSSYMVIGRPITKPPTEVGSRLAAVRRIIEEVSIGLGERGG